MLNIPFRMGWLPALGLAFSCFAVQVAALEDSDGAVKPIIKGSPHEAFFAIEFNGDRALAVGAGGAIYQSDDAGKNWKREAQEQTQLAVLDADIHDQQTIVVGQFGLIMRSTSPGKWEKIDAGTEMRLLAVAQNDTGLAFAVGQFGVILRSKDGGKTWKSVAPDWAKNYNELNAEPQLYDVTVTDSGVVTTIGEFGLIVRSTDGGETWNKVNGGGRDESSLFALSFDPSAAPAAGSAQSAPAPAPKEEKTDEKLVANTVLNIRAKATTDSEVVGQLQPGDTVTVIEAPEGDWAKIKHDSGEAWVFRPLTKSSTEVANGDGGAGQGSDQKSNNKSALAKSNITGYAVGQAGSVLKTTDGGVTWEVVDAGTDAILLSVYQNGDGLVMISGIREMLESTDDGKSWTKIRGADINISWYQDIGSAGGDAPILAVGRAGEIIQVMR